MKHAIQCFVLFSVIVIVASVVVLLLPFKGPAAVENEVKNSVKNPGGNRKMPHARITMPSAANQPSLSVAAGSADGSSDHQHLLDNLLKKQDKLIEAYAGRRNNPVSATTTQRNGIASTSADQDYGKPGEWRVLAGCSDKCVKIDNTANAVNGNCVNPPISETNQNPDYSNKYCMAFRPPINSMRDQECMTCGYYAYKADCNQKADPKNPARCTKYGDYTYQAPTGANAKSYYDCSGNPVCKLFLKKGGGGGGTITPENSGPVCSATTCKPKEVTISGVTSSTKKCVIPGCLSNNGSLPYPKDFYGNDMINPCKKNPSGSGYICPAVTFGSTISYGGSDDPCYNTNGRPDITKFQSINQICNSVRPSSEQNFKPGTSDSTSKSDTSKSDTSKSDTSKSIISRRSRRSTSNTGTSNTGTSNTGTNDNVINVYHHYISGKPKWSNTYKYPESGLIYLGIY